MSDQNNYISRKLTWLDSDQNQRSVEDVKVLSTFAQPLLILGEPGMGKTKLMEMLSDSPECTFIRATSLLRQPESSIFGETILVIDGLDEVASVEEGDSLHKVLKKLIAWGKPRFIISCRSSEWSSATGKLDISDEYGEAPLELTIEPLTDEDALQVFSQEITLDKARDVISTLTDANLDGLYRNPLTLKFLVVIVRDKQALPETRAGLYELAVDQLRREDNDRYANGKLAQLSKESSLNAAGSVMASMLITGCDCITKETMIDGALPLSELSDLEKAESILAVIGSNLFNKESVFTDRFQPIHRTVAEFLGARWLAKVIEKKECPDRVADRFLGLIYVNGGVPSSLRGLHAWLCKFSPELLGPKAIKHDPYGILLYGDGDNLTLSQASKILKELEKLADFDPNFRTDWKYNSGITLKGLVRPELYEKVRSIIKNESLPFDLRTLILKSIGVSSHTIGLKDDLLDILLDSSRYYSERRYSADAILKIKNCSIEWPDLLESLIDLDDEDSTRLAVSLLADINLDALSEDIIARTILADTGVINAKKKQKSYV